MIARMMRIWALSPHIRVIPVIMLVLRVGVVEDRGRPVPARVAVIAEEIRVPLVIPARTLAVEPLRG